MSDNETVAKALGEFGFHEIGKVSTYKGYRKDASGQNQPVTVEVVERLTNDMPRYWIEARDEHGREAFGNGHDDLQLALLGVHWSDLEKAPPQPPE